MGEQDAFRHESVQDRHSITRYLRALLEGFESGRLELGSPGQSLVLEPHGVLDLEIKARRKDGRSRITLRVTWREDDGGSSGGEALTIRG